MLRSSLLALCLASSAMAAEPQWFKGNTHAHSLWSDGDDFPEMITDWYVKNGYAFLGLSDHNTLARGERWLNQEAVEKKRKGLGRKVIDKYRDRFGADWVQTRVGEGDKPEVRLRTFEEYRTLFEKPGAFMLIETEEVSAGMAKVPVHINAVNVAEAIQPIKDLATVKDVLRANMQAAPATQQTPQQQQQQQQVLLQQPIQPLPWPVPLPPSAPQQQPPQQHEQLLSCPEPQMQPRAMQPTMVELISSISAILEELSADQGLTAVVPA